MYCSWDSFYRKKSHFMIYPFESILIPCNLLTVQSFYFPNSNWKTPGIGIAINISMGIRFVKVYWLGSREIYQIENQIFFKKLKFKKMFELSRISSTLQTMPKNPNTWLIFKTDWLERFGSNLIEVEANQFGVSRHRIRKIAAIQKSRTNKLKN